jgi:hypothetical protein
MVPAYGMVLGLPMATHIYTISTSVQHTFFHSEFICYNRPWSFIPSSYRNHSHHCQQVKIISLQHDLCNKAPQGHWVKSADRKRVKQALSQ